MNDKTIILLTDFDTKDWYLFFDKVFEFKKLEEYLHIPYETASDYFVDLNSFLIRQKDKSLLLKYHTVLTNYYYDLPIVIEYLPKIYSFHWIFANIKIRINIEGFYHQLFKDVFNNIYYEKIHLHTSLLSLIIELPNFNNFDVSTYLFTNLERFNDLSFFRVSFRFLIQKSTINELFTFIGRVIEDKNNQLLGKIIVETIMDCRDYYGSFKHIFNQISKIWSTWESNYPEVTESIISILNAKYLANGKKWYDNDIYAKKLKMFINSVHFPPPVSLLYQIHKESTEKNEVEALEIEKATNLILRNNTKWKSKIVVDDYDDSDENNIVCIEDYPIELENHYQSVYGIQKHSSYVRNANPSFIFLIFANCNKEYNSIVKPIVNHLDKYNYDK